MSAARPEDRLQPTSMAVRLAVIADRPDLPVDVREELISVSMGLREGVVQLGDGRIAFTAGALAAALGLTSVGHLGKWRKHGVGPKAVALQHDKKTTWVYTAAAVREWLAAVATDTRVRPTDKMIRTMVSLGMVEQLPAVQEAA